MKVRVYGSLLLALAAAGCGTPAKELNREEYLAATTRVYAETTVEKLIADAERVLRASDPSAFKFAYTDDGFTAFKTAASIGGIGAEQWEFHVRDVAGGKRGSIQIRTTRQGGGFSPAPTTTAGTFALMPGPTALNFVPGDAAYSLFWARMDYMQWVRSDWMTCDDAEKPAVASKVTGPLDSLCGHNVPDDVPGKPRGSRRPQPSPQIQMSRPVQLVSEVITPDRVRP